MAKKVKELPVSERPYEKCSELGPAYLTDSELLAVILRSGSKELNSLELAREILDKTGPEKSISGIEYLDDNVLLGIPGIGRVKLVLLRCLTEYSKRLWKARIRGNLRFNRPEDCASFFMEDMRHLTQEEVRAVLLDTKANFISSVMLTKGLSDSALISPKEVYSYALKNNASQVIVVHNHPSGDPTPSREDVATASKLKRAGDMIGVSFSDSIIIGDGRYVSLRKQYSADWENL